MAKRRRRREPFWPIVLLIGLVAVGLGLANLIPGSGGLEQDEVESVGESILDVTVPTLEDRIRVEVLNGGGIQGVAAQATEVLRDRGFDVVYFGNESSFGRDSSVIVDRTMRSGALDSVSRSLDIAATRIDPDSARLVDITVLLGTDWAPESGGGGEPDEAARGGETGSMDRPWWDFRRFLQAGR